jgi:hypothetical protein
MIFMKNDPQNPDRYETDGAFQFQIPISVVIYFLLQLFLHY